MSIWRTLRSALEEECACLYFHRHAVLQFLLKRFSPFVLFRTIVATGVGVAAGADVGIYEWVVYREQEIARERVAQMVNRGVPVLDERDVRKATEVQLTALCSWATVPMVASVACTFARGVTYACKSAAGEAPVGIPASANSANYFEVTVMNPGEKTTIGIGLADPDIFPATKQMPGWVDHSYGYHGDDGRKFGRGKTDTIWPIWADGDVIGCGFDPVRGAIWWVGKPASSERLLSIGNTRPSYGVR